MINARTPQDYRRHQSRLKNDVSMERLVKNSSMQRIPAFASNSDLHPYEGQDVYGQASAQKLGEHLGHHITVDLSQPISPININNAILDVGLAKNGRN
mmetsp:Transcript_24383/g.32645  ORF Transcript_24383/g.32645 Transcript_24383/m.32645 type:complete len:98 (+) Transcript_24383:1736-2029(+)|eukprot:CAMPEP_0185574190 /NCGR_PEP_ID=MMETSP0434-20130131/5723_1 /TAXON_ID=626734 ORGANISM="Favella taraikaensis, Strain Fe Narragansett Bay" /NCGR_SAMPLE_ID=MMETSP0434 /ASSEMBLY_ACC=CAM_ASM_000379 /LENGTH=97 /DNA_ID=CAMNT_0028190687 /DNA_START=1732 /DNA_END=2025 /DNA_ORIENTATION=+